MVIRWLPLWAVLAVFVCAVGAAQAYTDVDLAFQVDTPDGWEESTPAKPAGWPLMKAWTAPAKAASITLGVLDMRAQPAPPRKFVLADESVARSTDTNAYRLLGQGPLDVSGVPGYGSTSQLSVGGTLIKRRRAYLAADDRLFTLTCEAAADRFETFAAGFEAAIRSFRFVEAPKPNTYQEIAAGSYYNRSCQLEVERPAPDWLMYTTRPADPSARCFLVVAAPDGASAASLSVVRMQQAVAPRQLAQSALTAIRRQDTNASQQSARMVTVGGHRGFSTLIEFTLAGQRRLRWYVFAVKDETAYIIVAEAAPADYARWRDAFRKLVASLKIG